MSQTGPSCFLFDANLAQLVTFNLAQLATVKNGHCLPLFAFKNVLKYLFYSAFEHQPKFAPKRAPQNDNFSHFAKHGLKKKNFCCNPPLDQKVVFFKMFVLKPKTFILNKNIT